MSVKRRRVPKTERLGRALLNFVASGCYDDLKQKIASDSEELNLPSSPERSKIALAYLKVHNYKSRGLELMPGGDEDVLVYIVFWLAVTNVRGLLGAYCNETACDVQRALEVPEKNLRSNVDDEEVAAACLEAMRGVFLHFLDSFRREAKSLLQHLWYWLETYKRLTRERSREFSSTSIFVYPLRQELGAVSEGLLDVSYDFEALANKVKDLMSRFEESGDDPALPSGSVDIDVLRSYLDAVNKGMGAQAKTIKR